MDHAKRKISVTLDADLVAELESAGGSVSAQLNEAVRAEVQRRRNHHRLREFLDELDAVRGPVDTDEDQAEMARIAETWRRLDRARPLDERAS